MAAICCFCFTYYQDVEAPAIGSELIESHDASNHSFTGDSMPLVEIQIAPQQTVIGEPGAMCFMQDGIKLESKFDDGARVEEPGACTKSKLSCARSCSGESMSMAFFTNESQEARTVAFGSDTPGHIVAVNLKEIKDNVLFTMNGSFMFGARGTRVDVVRADCMQCCFGAGLCFQKIDGDGMVFINGGGTVIKQELDGKTHRIDPNSLLAFTKGLEVNVQRSGGCCTMCCGGEGVALTTITGTGTYWLSSSPIQDQISYALQFLPPKN